MAPGRVLAEYGVLGVPDSVVTDVEVEVAVTVEVGEGRRGRPIAAASQSSLLGDIFEGAVAPVAIQGIRSPSRDEQIRMSIVVDFAHRHTVAISPGKGSNARRF